MFLKRQKGHFIIFIGTKYFSFSSRPDSEQIYLKISDPTRSRYISQWFQTSRHNYVRLILASGNFIPLSINQRDFYRSIRQNLSPERSATLPIGDLAKTSPPTEKLEAGGGPVGEERSSLEKGQRCKATSTKVPTAI
jgi:hypothetical protein